mmetsp:Transcript_43308/g.43996  ORF Transcript_43308/g.43996 Transcript_43308/m.43996 type:complete len:143 (-) Transcript_43308:259-687(-)
MHTLQFNEWIHKINSEENHYFKCGLSFRLTKEQMILLEMLYNSWAVHLAYSTHTITTTKEFHQQIVWNEYYCRLIQYKKKYNTYQLTIGHNCGWDEYCVDRKFKNWVRKQRRYYNHNVTTTTHRTQLMTEQQTALLLLIGFS